MEEHQVYPLAAHLDFAAGALVEPTACAVHGIDVMAPRAGDTVLQFGAGPTGLVLAQLLRHNGAASITLVDLSPAKLALAARQTGAETVQVRREAPEAHLDALHARAPQGYDLVIDATGVPRVQERLPQFAALGGKVVFYGVAPEDARITISPYEIFRRELTLLGSFSQAHTFDRASRLVNAGVVQLADMVTHTFSLEGWADALRLMQDGRESIKIVIAP